MEEWINQIDRTTKKFTESFGGLSPEQLNWKANSKTWSIAQNIAHIILVNRSYFPKIDDLKQGKNKLPFLAKFGFIVTFFGNSIKGYAQPDRKKRTKTFRIWEADKSNFSKNILDDFQKHQAELKKYIEDSGNLIKGKAIISSPANKYFVYTLEAAFDIIVVHEERHYNQAMELLEGMLRASAASPVV